MHSELESDMNHVPFRAHCKVHKVHLLLIGDVILMKVKTGQGVVWFLHSIVTVLPFATNKQSVRRHFEIIQISCSPPYFPYLQLVSTHDACPSQLLS